VKIVVKVGSSILTDTGPSLKPSRVAAVVRDICQALQMGHQVVLVSSGAIAAGMGKLGLRQRPRDIRLKQAIAAVGQSSLMWAYEKAFQEAGRKVAQVLLTREDFTDKPRYINSRNTILALLDLGVVPVVNENDTVSVEEIRFGDNDQLAALVASLIGASRLVILSDVDGLYEEDPRRNPKARLIPRVKEITPELLRQAGGGAGRVGTGGMYSKLLAARKAMQAGIVVNIINGHKEGLLQALLQGQQVGTEFQPGLRRLPARKGWIAYGLRAQGKLVIDEGAKEAILKRGKSLLPSGVLAVEGSFKKGDAVYCVDAQGRRLAKGLVNYSCQEIERIKGRKTSELERLLGYRYSDEVIHRDNLVLLT
jgi:glutamate 5-kinase